MKKKGFCGHKVDWSFDNGILTISGTGEMFNYNPAGGIWGPWPMPWKDFGEIQVVIEEGVTHIGSWAFDRLYTNCCISSIPNSVVSIGHSAFEGCDGVGPDLVIPEGVTIIESSALIVICSLLNFLTVWKKLNSMLSVKIISNLL